MPPAVQIQQIYPEDGWYVLWGTDVSVPASLRGTSQRIVMWGLGTDNITVEPFVNDESGDVVQAITISTSYTLEHPLQWAVSDPVTLLDSVTAEGPGPGQDLGFQVSNLTMHVTSTDDLSQVVLEGSLEGNNWWGMGAVAGSGALPNNQGYVVQYVRANVLSLNGTVTVTVGFAS